MLSTFISGLFGLACNRKCGFCQNLDCDQTTGQCGQLCKDGYWWVSCNATCLYTGCQTCIRSTVCLWNMYTRLLWNQLWPNMQPVLFTKYPKYRSCEMTSGNCTDVCMSGHWSGPCTRNCSSTCLQEQIETVYVRDSGNCQFDCEALW